MSLEPLLPTLFVSHGSPMFALEPGITGPALGEWARALPHKPNGIVLMSPHWMAEAPLVMTHATPATWHDFGGFPDPLYRLQYPAPGDPGLARKVLSLFREAGLAAGEDPRRPFDHGAWVPLRHLFPAADIPVVQVALPAHADAGEVWAMGHALAKLRAAGVLFVGSGSMTHNLAEFFSGDREPVPYVDAFSRWVEAVVTRGDRVALLDYRAQAPDARRAHPTEEHFLPIFFTLGAAGWGEDGALPVEVISREVMYGRLAMDAFAVGSVQPG